MPISAGSRLGPYEIVAPIVAGGMGEVFKARDTRLDRSVAIKVLPAEFAENEQLKTRFEREAKTISQLNHPHICTLYDVGDGYLVMELLEGENLADKIAKGPLPLDQVLRYGIQIAEALDKAHKADVVHRDLKPGNIMITKSGAKLLDFGLAKPNETGAISALTSLRTEKRNLTEEGTIVGTFQYMAPEQVEGAGVDARTDIFALGAVLYEMATGRRAFEGKSKASLIASILTAEPKPISSVQPMTPASFDRAVRTCLQKEPDERWQSAHDVAIELRAISEPAADEAVRRKSPVVPWSIAAVFAIAAVVFALLAWNASHNQKPESVIRTQMLPPSNGDFDFLLAGAPPAISPDGTRIVFGARESGKKRLLYLRSLESLTPQPLTGTEDASFPFWSPDGRFIAFFADNALKKMEISGGAAVTLCEVSDGRGGSWSPDGSTIIFGGRYTTIYRVPSAGGTPVEVTKLSGADTTHRWPEFLPDSRHFLYLGSPTGNEDSTNWIYVGSIDGQPARALISSADDPHYLDGAIIFSRNGIMTAQRFDPGTLAISGDAVPLKEQHVEATSLFAKSVMAIGRSGTLVYQTGLAVRDSQVTWLDRTGKSLGVVGDPGPVNGLALSPDGKSIGVKYTTNGTQANLWDIDLVRGAKTRMTFTNGQEFGPLWSPDGRSIVYSSLFGRTWTMHMKNMDTGKDEELAGGTVIAGIVVPTSWSPDGKTILFNIAGSGTTRGDIWSISLDDRKPRAYLQTPFIEGGGRFSPDGHWVAYTSNEAGANEIYIAPFPATGAKWQISTMGGVAPRWRADGREIFYVAPGNPATMYSVPIKLGATPEIDKASKLFEFMIGMANAYLYDITPDGRRFVVNKQMISAPVGTPLVVVQHFDRELRDALDRRD